MSLNEYNIVSQARYKTLGVHDINFQSKNSSSQYIALTTDRSYDDIKSFHFNTIRSKNAGDRNTHENTIMSLATLKAGYLLGSGNVCLPI